MKQRRYPLASLLDSAAESLEAQLPQAKEPVASGPDENTAPFAGIIYSGNPHETVPRRLLLDNRLTPLERNAWQVFRLLVNGDGVTAFPTYEQLRPYLGMQPGKPASRETVAKTLTLLRLTRWLSLGRRVRHGQSGQIRGNVYLLHDEPVSPAEALEFDKDYLQLLGQSMEHANRAIRDSAELAWREFSSDPDIGHRLPTRLTVIEERLSEQHWTRKVTPAAIPTPRFGIRTQQEIDLSAPVSDSEPGKKAGKRIASSLRSDAEPSRIPGLSDRVRHPSTLSTYTNTTSNVCTSHVPPPGLDTAGRWILALESLPSEQKMRAVSAMQRIPASVRDSVISQWLSRCEDGAVSNPLGYLLKLTQLAMRGEFNAEWRPAEVGAPAGASAVNISTATAADLTPQAAAQERSPETMRTAREQLASLHALLRAGHSGRSLPSGSARTPPSGADSEQPAPDRSG